MSAQSVAAPSVPGALRIARFAMILSLATLILGGVAAGEGNEPSSDDVQIPVLLDGTVLVEAAAFNAMRPDLERSLGEGDELQFLTLRSEDPFVYVFTSFERMSTYLRSHDLAVPTSPEAIRAELLTSGSDGEVPATVPAASSDSQPFTTSAQTCADDRQSYYSVWDTSYYCIGSKLFIAPGAPGSQPNLTGSWNNSLSSIACSYNSYVTYCVSFKDPYYGGTPYYLVNNGYIENLAAVGYNENISSLIVQTSN